MTTIKPLIWATCLKPQRDQRRCHVIEACENRGVSFHLAVGNHGSMVYGCAKYEVDPSIHGCVTYDEVDPSMERYHVIHTCSIIVV